LVILLKGTHSTFYSLEKNEKENCIVFIIKVFAFTRGDDIAHVLLNISQFGCLDWYSPVWISLLCKTGTVLWSGCDK
jgi:hypothetical protein